jgi:hypothetical protein
VALPHFLPGHSNSPPLHDTSYTACLSRSALSACSWCSVNADAAGHSRRSPSRAQTEDATGDRSPLARPGSVLVRVREAQDPRPLSPLGGSAFPSSMLVADQLRARRCSSSCRAWKSHHAPPGHIHCRLGSMSSEDLGLLGAIPLPPHSCHPQRALGCSSGLAPY